MVNAQKWLDRNYPKKERKLVSEIHIKEELEEKLDLSDFTSRDLKVYLYPDIDHDQCQIINQSIYAEIIQLIEAKEYLEKHYPIEERSEIKWLDINGRKIGGRKLIGLLDLNDFKNLEKLDCSDNQLTNLALTRCTNLEELICWSNKFTELKLINLTNLKKIDCGFNEEMTKLDCSNCQLTTLGLYNNLLGELNCSNNQFTDFNFLINGCEELTALDISNNKIAHNDEDFHEALEMIFRCVKLKKLDLSDNPLSVSLEILKYCKDLEELNINNTQIASGLEYLPESLKEIYCEGTKLIEDLKDYKVEEDETNNGYYDYQDWRQDHWKEITFVKFPLSKDEIDSLEKENQELKSKLANQLEKNDSSQQVNPRFIDYENFINKKESELERKKKKFEVYVEKRNEEKMEKVEEEITKLEAEINELKLERNQEQQTQIQIPPK